MVMLNQGGGMKLHLTPADVMRLLEYALNELEFKGPKQVVNVDCLKGTGDVYVVEIVDLESLEKESQRADM